MDKTLTYKGFVCLNSDTNTYLLIVKSDEIFHTIPISGSEKKFEDITSDSIYIVGVKFYDGTEQVDMTYSLETDFEDILMSISKCAKVEMFEVSDIFNEISGNYKETSDLWNLVDDYFNTEDGIKNFDEFVNREQF